MKGTMKFTIIEQPPKNADEYTEASVWDNEADHAINLRELLKAHPFPIRTTDVPLGWAR